MKTFKQLQEEYKQGLIDLDDRFFDYEDLKQMDLKAINFVKHIENHLKEMSPEQKDHGKVMCKICNKTIDEINKVDTMKRSRWWQPVDKKRFEEKKGEKKDEMYI